MSTLHENLRRDISDLLEKYKQQTLTISDINSRIPEMLTQISGLLGGVDLSISNPKSEPAKYLVIIDGDKHYYTETQVAKLRRQNNANLLLDMPRLTLTIHITDNKKEIDFEELPYPAQRIIEWGMTYPGELISKEKFWDTATLKRYIFTTRQLLNDNAEKHIIKASEEQKASYCFNHHLKHIVIKNLKSTQHPPTINNANL